ncbi:MAG: hypothetical protein QOJ39_3 [Candidatus Eremiobacteraeota bacterium]|jgi:uncharacterized protein YecE (DUF72 family)|nr:hypothetical protein [Candidatus Eremiobacteraeota bacterium]
MYDAGTRPEGYLREYADEFRSVEIDSTFYGTPQPDRVRKWAAQVPDGFTFALKLPREITHDRRLLGSRKLVEEFVASALEFEDKLEAILIQTAPDFVPAEIDAVEEFMRELPAGPRWAFEVRDRDWFHGEPHQRLRDALGTHGVALAVSDGPFVSLETMLHELRRPTASHAYIRWLGTRESVPRFDQLVIDRAAQIAQWAEAIRDTAPQLVRIAGYANNQYAGHSPGTIRMVYDALGVAHERPKRIEQTSLFD